MPAAPTTPPIRHRKLRIALSAICAIACTLLIALWARSASTLDFFSRVDYQKIQTTIGSQYGHVYFARFNAELAYKGTGNSYTSHDWTFTSLEMPGIQTPILVSVLPDPPAQRVDFLELTDGRTPRFLWDRDQNALNIEIPYWFLVLVIVLAGTLPWLRWRPTFGLRSLFLAVTIAAALFGFGIWLLNGSGGSFR